jgi:hypothetical protein
MMIARRNLAAAGFEDRFGILLADCRDLKLPPAAGKTLYVGNPPDVRHHLVLAKWKTMADPRRRAALGPTPANLRACMCTSFWRPCCKLWLAISGRLSPPPKWLDVDYGPLMRAMFLNGLGGQSLTVVEPMAKPFSDAATTAAISTFQIGSKPKNISHSEGRQCQPGRAAPKRLVIASRPAGKPAALVASDVA